LFWFQTEHFVSEIGIDKLAGGVIRVVTPISPTVHPNRSDHCFGDAKRRKLLLLIRGRSQESGLEALNPHTLFEQLRSSADSYA
jgi:hypothetical protein